MNNYPDPNAVRFLHESVVNRFVKLLAMRRLGPNEISDHNRMEETKASIRDEDIVVNPDRSWQL